MLAAGDCDSALTIDWGECCERFASHNHSWYHTAMTTLSDNVLDQLLGQVSECFTVEGASKLAELRASPAVQARIDELADKCNAGTLSPDERATYESYVRTIKFISVLQSKARSFLSGKSFAK
ncbi:MAG: hypothetical protein ACKV0T_14350 [Planctomycetales bacterium]